MGSRSGNARLAALLAQAGLSHAQVARAFVRVALENGADEFAAVGRSHVSHWVAGTVPSGRAPWILQETLSRRLGRTVTADEIGLTESAGGAGDRIDWLGDTLAAIIDLGRVAVDAERRRVLGAAAYSVAALAVPGPQWWTEMVQRSGDRTPITTRSVGRGDVDAVREMVSMFSQVDQRRGGGHARTAVVQYLTSDVANCLRGRFSDDGVRRDMFSAASELVYLAGWMAFDNAEHATAQHFFIASVKLAAEADDPPMAGHVLRAMAHQALDLGHVGQALTLATASLDGQRFSLASPREKALLGVVNARALATSGQHQAAATALVRAENDLSAATSDDDEPSRVFFFGEASLAHEMACTMRDLGDLSGAVREFQRSVRTREAAAFTRTHAVTLGYLGSVQAQQGNLDEACGTWSSALSAMDGVRSGRTRQVANNMRSVLASFRHRGVHAVSEVDARAAAYLAVST